jgi:hypothetical protein
MTGELRGKKHERKHLKLSYGLEKPFVNLLLGCTKVQVIISPRDYSCMLRQL